MIKAISQIKVTDEQLKILEEYKSKQFQLKKEIHADIFPALVEGLRQVRELEQNIAIIAGAIASFTIPVVNTSFVQIKFLSYFALVFLFITICYAVYHLSEVITKEVNELTKQHSTYNNLLDEVVSRINDVIETGDINKLNDFDHDEVLSKLDGLKSPQKIDKSLNWLRGFLFTALGLLVLSFVPSWLYLSLWQILINCFK